MGEDHGTPKSQSKSQYQAKSLCPNPTKIIQQLENIFQKDTLLNLAPKKALRKNLLTPFNKRQALTYLRHALRPRHSTLRSRLSMLRLNA